MGFTGIEDRLPDKSRLFAMLIEKLREDLAAITGSQRAAQSGATHAEARAEGPKDMRSTEASYLARGLAERAEALRCAVAVLEAFVPRVFSATDVVSVGALVLSEDEAAEPGAYLIVPVAGGETLDVAPTPVRTLTPAAPLGRRLVGCAVGDRLVAPGPAGRELCVVALR